MTNQTPVVIVHGKEYRGTHDADIQTTYTPEKTATLADLENLMKNDTDWIEIRMAYTKLDKESRPERTRVRRNGLPIGD